MVGVGGVAGTRGGGASGSASSCWFPRWLRGLVAGIGSFRCTGTRVTRLVFVVDEWIDGSPQLVGGLQDVVDDGGVDRVVLGGPSDFREHPSRHQELHGVVVVAVLPVKPVPYLPVA